MLKWGYPKDEYTETGNFSPQMYVREARRMIGAYVMTQANSEGKAVVKDGVGVAAYTMDSHNCQRVVVNGMVKNEGDVQVGGFGPYPVSYRSIIPKATECTNLLVPVCLSASHIAYGSIRMEPVFMVLAQAAATAANVAIASNTSVQEVNIEVVQNMLKKDPLADGSKREILVDDADTGQVIQYGAWRRKERAGFGPTSLTIDESSEMPNMVMFYPLIPAKGKYKVYWYYLANYSNLASKTKLNISFGANVNTVIIEKSAVQVQGQTSGTWILLGEYTFPKGKVASITIDATGADGASVADAVLLVPVGK
jgi:hypothetical protein